MARKTTYIFETEEGFEHTYDIVYDITTPYADLMGEEPDLDSVLLIKITEDEVELPLGGLPDKLVEDIKFYCLEEFEDDQWDYADD